LAIDMKTTVTALIVESMTAYLKDIKKKKWFWLNFKEEYNVHITIIMCDFLICKKCDL
jgi:hypothetical protein